MGIGVDCSVFFEDLLTSGALKQNGSIVFIGSQQFHLEKDVPNGGIAEMRRLVELFPTDDPLTDEEIEMFAQRGYADDFFRRMGFTVESVDLDPKATYQIDLNISYVPEELFGKFDLALNLGTSEHIANQINAMKFIHDLIAPGGSMVHMVPFLGDVNHGIVNYQPSFFVKLARANHYDCRITSYYVGDDDLSDVQGLDNPELIASFGKIPNLRLKAVCMKFLHALNREELPRDTHGRIISDFKPPMDLTGFR